MFYNPIVAFHRKVDYNNESGNLGWRLRYSNIRRIAV